MRNLRLVKITEELSEKIYDMYQEIPREEEYNDINIANGLSKDDFRKLCVIYEMSDKGILLDYITPIRTYYILFDGNKPVGWFLLKQEKLRDEFKHAGHIGYAIRPSERGKGYGTAGLEMIVKKAQGLNYKQVRITTDDENTASVKLLEKSGFKKLPDNHPLQVYTRGYIQGCSQWYKDLDKEKER